MRERILIVEDSRTQAVALELFLSESGYEVEVASNGEDGLRCAASSSFDLILSDILMPGLNGFELCRKIKSRPELYGTPPVVLLTSLGDPIYIVRGLEAGADNYLVKPYEPEQLLSRIRRIFENRAAQPVRAGASEVAVEFLGEEFNIRAKREQILDFFISSFEGLLDLNRALQESERTLQKILEREKAARRAAEAAAIARDLVLATVSHDLRNPLSTILISTRLLLDSGVVAHEPRVRERVGVIEKVVGQMTTLIEDLLDLSTIEAGGLAIERRPVDPVALAREGVEMLEPIAAGNGVEIDVDLPDELPEVHADWARGLQVISNILGNAIKFSSKGDQVALRLILHNDEVIYKISDQGPGIEPESLPHIFDRFWRDEDSTESGAGLGLSIARWIVETHGGRIWVESEPGRGSTFHFSLPTMARVQPA